MLHSDYGDEMSTVKRRIVAGAATPQPFSLNIEGEGIPISYVVDDDTEGQRKSKMKIVCLADRKSHVENPYRFLQLSHRHHFELAVNTEARQVLYVCGASGSGKSYFMKTFVLNYHKIFPKRPIFLFSALGSDETLDKIKTIKRVEINDEFMDEVFEISDFANSLILFDDCDTISEKAKKMKVMSIFNMIAELGRHENVSTAWLSHTANAGHETKKILNESTSVTFFPQTMGNRALKYLLETTFGLDKKQIEKIRNLDSRAVTILKTYPMTLMSERLCCFVKDLTNV